MDLSALKFPPLKPVLRAAAPKLLLDGVLPIGVYYVLRTAGVPDLTALIAGASAIVVRAVVSAGSQRRVGGVTIFTLAMFAVALIGATTMDDPRFVLVKDSIPRALGGLACLVTLAAGKPMAFRVGVALMGADDPTRQAAWSSLWKQVPLFRGTVRVVTVVWGAGLLFESLATALVIYRNPIEISVVAGAATSLIVLGALIAWSVWYIRRARTALIALSMSSPSRPSR